MTCEEFLELAAAYTRGILDDGERAACVAHLAEAEHRGCLDAVADARDISSKLVVTLPVPQPSPDVWRAIESRLGAGAARPGGGGASPDGGPAVAGAVMVTPTAAPPAKALISPRVWRELAGWFVAAAVVGFHLYNVPVDTQRQAAAGTGARRMPGDPLGDSGRAALALMVAPGTRLATFAAGREGLGGASVMLNVGEKKAVVVARAGKVSGSEALRLWTVRGQLPPTSLGPLTPSAGDSGPDADELASVSVGAALFEPSLADKLLISVDTPEASAPQAVLLSATLH